MVFSQWKNIQVIIYFNFEAMFGQFLLTICFTCFFARITFIYNGYAIILLQQWHFVALLWHNYIIPLKLSMKNTRVFAQFTFNVYLFCIRFESKLLYKICGEFVCLLHMPSKMYQQRNHIKLRLILFLL